MATPLEWVVVHSFWDIEPSVAVQRQGCFSQWSLTDLYDACFQTDNVVYTSERMFGNKDFHLKLRRYCGLFSGACAAFEEEYHTRRDPTIDESLSDVVRSMAGGLDPRLYVLMMKRRIDSLTAKLTRTTNSVDVWKNEAVHKGREIEELKSRIRYLNKKLGRSNGK